MGKIERIIWAANIRMWGRVSWVKNDIIGGEEGDVPGLLTDLPSLRKLTGRTPACQGKIDPMQG